MRASGCTGLIGPVGTVAPVVVDLGRFEGDGGIAYACEGRFVCIELGNCRMVIDCSKLILFGGSEMWVGPGVWPFSLGLVMSPFVVGRCRRSSSWREQNDLHSGPTPRGRLSDAAIVP